MDTQQHNGHYHVKHQRDLAAQLKKRRTRCKVLLQSLAGRLPNGCPRATWEHRGRPVAHSKKHVERVAAGSKLRAQTTRVSGWPAMCHANKHENSLYSLSLRGARYRSHELSERSAARRKQERMQARPKRAAPEKIGRFISCTCVAVAAHTSLASSTARQAERQRPRGGKD